ncbi:GlsB/YeaQ/YmgE family stress response membrane protein [Mycolicibacterium sp. F2034L]|uniref:GlsB/YeaQ/YmgE family stress response membrane protein n=1 Tax=Mycolicibacterium sp. F2034L TaxID=2926422 RepID=UPI001FF617DC|nr:GlsB/YeaQ/YmgE family stress response membrane protein [Mycolicibacterium sp. F2034L]MCK0177089.1 GlsB/YeaQ/YmgE family stress response membrane protein [Mycolicibacterium sp. F2034L]
MGTIIVALVVGAILGALARLIMPGKQNIGVIITVALGAVGALLGSWISNEMFGTGDKMFSPIPFLIGLVVAVILIAIYVGVTGRRGTRPGTNVR